MRTVLLACELGGNLGHIGPLSQLSLALQREGWCTPFALKDVVGAKAIITDANRPIYQAPVWPKAAAIAGRPFRISNYADLLALVGFADADGLAAMVGAWDALLALLNPDLIVADFSPTLCLAAHGAIPTALVGNGYVNPPADDAVFPPLDYDRPPLIAQSRLLETIHAVQRRRGRPAPGTLPALFSGPRRAVTTWPELDPYRGVRREPVIGPLERMPAKTPLPSEPGIFAYLGDEQPALEMLLQSLLELGVGIEVYLRGDVGALQRLLASRGVRVHSRPPPLSDVLLRARVVVSSAGATTAHAALAAGRPQVLVPLTVELELTAAAVVALGAGRSVRQNPRKEEIDAALKAALADEEIGRRAQTCADAIAARPALDPLAHVTELCLRLSS